MRTIKGLLKEEKQLKARLARVKRIEAHKDRIEVRIDKLRAAIASYYVPIHATTDGQECNPRSFVTAYP